MKPFILIYEEFLSSNIKTTIILKPKFQFMALSAAFVLLTWVFTNKMQSLKTIDGKIIDSQCVIIKLDAITH